MLFSINKWKAGVKRKLYALYAAPYLQNSGLSVCYRIQKFKLHNTYVNSFWWGIFKGILPCDMRMEAYGYLTFRSYRCLRRTSTSTYRWTPSCWDAPRTWRACCAEPPSLRLWESWTSWRWRGCNPVTPSGAWEAACWRGAPGPSAGRDRPSTRWWRCRRGRSGCLGYQVTPWWTRLAGDGWPPLEERRLVGATSEDQTQSLKRWKQQKRDFTLPVICNIYIKPKAL